MSDLKIQGVVEVSTEGVESSLNRVGTAAENMSRKVETSADQAGKAVDGIGAGAGKSAEEFTRAEGKIVNSIKRATTQLEQLGKTASQKLEMNISAKGLDAAKFEPMLAKLRELESAQNRVVTSSRSFGGGLQNTSYQLQDFIVQVNGGTDATRALSMQLPQMLVGFGAAGAAIGVVAALLPNLIQAFGNAGESSKKFSDAMSDFDKAIGDVGSTVKAFDMDKLYEQFNKSSKAVQEATIDQIKFQQELIKTESLLAKKSFGESLNDVGMPGLFTGRKSATEVLAKDLGISLDLALKLQPALNGLRDGTGDVSSVFEKFGASLLSGNAKGIELAKTMATLSKSERDAAAASSALSEAQDKMAKGHVTTKKEVDDAAKARKESAKAAEAEAKALETLLDTINGKDSGFDSSYVKNVETLLKAYDKGKLSLSGFNEVFSRYLAMQPGAVAAARELEKAEKASAEARSKYLATVESETEKLVEKAKAAEYENSLIGATAEEISALTDARYQEKIELLQDKIAAIEMLEGRNAEVEAIEKQIDALRRLKSAEIAKPKLQAQAREWENFSRDIERSLTDALYRSFESGKDFGEAFADSLEATFKTMVLKFATQAVMTTGANMLNAGINALAGTSGTNGGAGTNYLGLANNASSIYNLAGAGSQYLYGASAGASSASLAYANAVGAMGGDSIGALYAANGGWAGVSTGAGTSAGSSAGASASTMSASTVAWVAAIIMGMYMSSEAWKNGVRWDETYANEARKQWWYGADSLAVNRDLMDAPAKAIFGSDFVNSEFYAILTGSSLSAQIHKAVQGALFGAGGPKDNSRYSYRAGEYETLTGGNAGVLQSFSASVAATVNAMAQQYGSSTRVAGREGWLSFDPRGTAQTQLNLELFDQIGNKLYSRMDSYGGNIENVGRSNEALNEAMSKTMRDALLYSVARADIGDAPIKALFDQFESGIVSLSKERSEALIASLGVGWLDDVLSRVDEAAIGLEGVADAAANLFAIAPLKDTFDRLGASIFDFGAVAESTTPLINGLKKTVTNEDGTQRKETWRETYLRTMDEFIAVGNILEATGRNVYEAFKNGTADSILAASDALVTLFGSVENMQTAFEAYYEDFYTSSEKTARAWELMQRQFDSLGLAMPKTRDGFRAVVDSLDLSTDAGQKAFAALIGLEREFAGLTPAIQSAAEAAKSVLTTSQSVTDAAFSALQRSVDAQRTQVQAMADAAQEQINALDSVFSVIKSNIADLRGATAASYGDALAQLDQMIGSAKNGYMPTSDQLSSVISSARSGLDQKIYASAADQQRDRLVLAGKLEDLQSIGDTQMSVAEQQLKAAEGQLTSLDNVLKSAQDQIDALRGIDNSVVSVSEAIQRMQDAIVSELASLASSLLIGLSSGAATPQDTIAQLEKAGVSVQRDAWTSVKTASGTKSLWASSGGAAAMDGSIYAKDGRTFAIDEAVGYVKSQVGQNNAQQVYKDAIAAGISAASLDAMMGWQAGTSNDWAKLNNLPAFAVGTNYVQRDMVAKIHEGEAIIPKPFNPWAGGSQSDSAVVEEVRGLKAEVIRLQTLLASANDHARRTANAVNGNPEAPILVEMA